MNKLLLLVGLGLLGCGEWSLAVAGSASKGVSSLLEGKNRLKIAVEETGIYRITYEDLYESGLLDGVVSSKAVTLLGRPAGLLLRHGAADTLGLASLPIFMKDGGDGLFESGDSFWFYGQSPHVVHFHSVSSAQPFSVQQHPYDTRQYYYIVLDSTVHREVFSCQEAFCPEAKVIKDFPDFYRHESELHNPNGTLSWLGEKLDWMHPVCQIKIPDLPVLEGHEAAVEWNFLLFHPYADAVSATLSLSVGKEHGVCPVDWDRLALYGYLRYKDSLRMSLSSKEKCRIELELPDNDTSLSVYLDYVQISYQRALEKSREGQLIVRSLEACWQDSRFELSAWHDPAELEVWDITSPLEVKRLSVKRIEQGIWGWGIGKSDTVKSFLVFEPEDVRCPFFYGLESGQNLRSMRDMDYIIVVHPDFASEARELALLHERCNGYATKVVTTREIYAEYSSGVKDPSAIRLFLRDVWNRSSVKPHYVLLFGDCSSDPKGILKKTTDFVPTFLPMEDAGNREDLILHEDAFACMDLGLGFYEEVPKSDISLAVGRFPVRTREQASEMLAKSRDYVVKTDLLNGISGNKIANFGDWRSEVAFVGGQAFVRRIEDSNYFSHAFEQAFPVANIRKIYSGKDSLRIRLARQRLKNCFDDGCFFVGYFGHGSSSVLGNEELLISEDIVNWESSCAMPVFFVSACSFGIVENPLLQSGAEKAVLHPSGGAIVVVAATGTVYIGSCEDVQTAFAMDLYSSSSGRAVTIGDAYLKAKKESEGDLSAYILLGDPGLKSPVPQERIETGFLNGMQVGIDRDTLDGLEVVQVEGWVNDRVDNMVDSGFNGYLHYTLLGSELQKIALDADVYGGTDTVYYHVQEERLVSGTVEVIDGFFSLCFRMPKSKGGGIVGKGKLSYYAYDEQGNDAAGYFDGFYIGNRDITTEVDSSVPVIYPRIVFKQEWVNGSFQDVPYLEAELMDDAGLCISGSEPGRSLRIVMDGKEDATWVVNDYFRFDAYSSRKGLLEYPLQGITGRHSFLITAWNVFGIPGRARIDYENPLGNENMKRVEVSSIWSIPNPSRNQGYTDFCFGSVTIPADYVQMEVFDAAGRKVDAESFSMGDTRSRSGFARIRWEWPMGGLEPGLYVCRFSWGKAGSSYSRYSKLLVL